jgi:hypothetical protein
MAEKDVQKGMNVVDPSAVDHASGDQAFEKAHRAPLQEGHQGPAMMQGGPQGPPPPPTPGGENVARPQPTPQQPSLGDPQGPPPTPGGENVARPQPTPQQPSSQPPAE